MTIAFFGSFSCAACNHRLRPNTTLRRPRQIESLIFLRAFLRIGVKLRRIFKFALSQSHVAKTRSRSRAKTAHLPELRNSSDAAARGFQRVFEMLPRCFEIVVGVSKAAHSQFITRIDDRDAILIEFLLRFEQQRSTRWSEPQR